MNDLCLDIVFVICALYIWLYIAVPVIKVVINFIKGENPDDNIKKSIHGLFYLIVVPVILYTLLMVLF